MVSESAQIKLAIVSTMMIDKRVPLDSIAERCRDVFNLDLSERQIAAVYAYWRKLGVQITKERWNYSENGYMRARSVYKTDGKSIKRLFDSLYNRKRSPQ